MFVGRRGELLATRNRSPRLGGWRVKASQRCKAEEPGSAVVVAYKNSTLQVCLRDAGVALSPRRPRLVSSSHARSDHDTARVPKPICCHDILSSAGAVLGS